MISERGPASSPRGWRGGIAWLGLAMLAGVLVAEVLLATIRFDSADAKYGLHLRWIPAFSSRIGRGLITTAVFVGLLGGRRLVGHFAGLLAAGEVRVSPRAIAAHVLAAWGFYATSLHLFTARGAGVTPAMADLLVAGWVASGLAAAIALALVLVPARSLRRFVAEDPGLWACGVLVGLATCLAGEATARLWAPLQQSTFRAVGGLLELAHADAIVDPASMAVGNDRFRVRIASACSGYEGMGMMAVFLAVYLWYRRAELRFPRVLLLLPLGVALAWAFNVLRIFALVEIGTFGSREVALGGFHSQAGWLSFNAIGLGLVLASRARAFRRDRSRGDEAEAGVDADVVAHVAPFAALLASTLATQAFSAGVDWLYPLRIVAVAAALWACRRRYREPLWAFSWPAVLGGAAAFAIWMAFEPAAAAGPGADKLAGGLAALPGWMAAAWIGLRALGSIVTVPMAEELVFRGYLLRRLCSPRFAEVTRGRVTVLAIVLSSAAFGALHSRWLAGAVTGILYALIYLRRGRLGESVLAHAVTNTLIAALAIATGAWSLWN